MEHHIWCNFALPSNPAETCKQCKRLWEKYPYDSEDEKWGLAAKHFPQAVLVRGGKPEDKKGD